MHAVTIFAAAQKCGMNADFIRAFTSIRPFMELIHLLVREYRVMMDPEACRGNYFVKDLIRRLAHQVGSFCVGAYATWYNCAPKMMLFWLHLSFTLAT